MSSTASILLVVFTSLLGTAYFMYGKKEVRVSFLVSGAALCVYSYFVDSFWISLLIGAALAAAPFFFER